MLVSKPVQLVPLREVDSADWAGGKAFHLAELARNGIPVPDAFVLPADVQELPESDVLAALGGCLAVRSSATCEDSASASFAGQLASFLNVRTQADLVRAVAAVRASSQTQAVRAYCAARGIDPAAVRTAVLVQRMVQADAAGVLFTVDPVSGCEDDQLIEALPGVADELLGGKVSGVRIAVRNGRPLGSTDPLTVEQVEQLVATGRRIQHLQGCPQDIEWAFESGQLFILQARPITRLCFGGIDGEWTNADFRDGGVASEVVTPLVWSLYEFVWDRAIKGFLKDLRLSLGNFRAARVFYGRPYWNLAAVKACARKLPGFIESEFDRDLGVQPRYTDDGSRTAATLGNILRALPTVVATAWVLRRQARRDRALIRSGSFQGIEKNLQKLEDRELLRSFRQLVESEYGTIEENYFRTICCISLARLAFKAVLGDLPVSYPVLVGGLDSLEHCSCTQALWELANGAANSVSSPPGMDRDRALEKFLARYGHHSRRELDLRVPRWSEEPGYVAELAHKLTGTESPSITHERQREHYAQELARVRQRLSPGAFQRFGKKLRRLRTYLWLREQLRDCSTRMYARIRRLALEIGERAAKTGRLYTAEDSFYLSFREIYQVFDTPCKALVEARRQQEQMYRHFHAPNEIGRGFSAAPVEPAGQRLRGIGCSAGAVSGQVRVVQTPAEAGKLQQGDILVCPFTDPGWTPLLNLAAGVIAENGGLLSHAAVLCREYGIPAVLNVAGATALLRDGQQVRIDGDHGYVDVL
jgi:phosphohistidine swiveling domain-containing protein